MIHFDMCWNFSSLTFSYLVNLADKRRFEVDEMSGVTGLNFFGGKVEWIGSHFRIGNFGFKEILHVIETMGYFTVLKVVCMISVPNRLEYPTPKVNLAPTFRDVAEAFVYIFLAVRKFHRGPNSNFDRNTFPTPINTCHPEYFG